MSELPPDRSRRKRYRREYQRKRREANRDAYNEYHRNWRKNNPGRQREYALRYKYGITQQEFDAMFEAQGYACAACESKDPGTKHGWHVDHCHEPFKVRGILCHPCNTTLGQHRECPERIMKLSIYAEKHK